MQSDRRKLWLDLWKQLEESTPARQQQSSGLGPRRSSNAPSVMRVTQPQLSLGISNNTSSESNLVLIKNLSKGYLAASAYAVNKVMANVQQDPRDARWRTFVQNDTITGILIGVWDNVTGPRVEHAWVNAKEDLNLIKKEQKMKEQKLKEKEVKDKEKEKENDKVENEIKEKNVNDKDVDNDVKEKKESENENENEKSDLIKNEDSKNNKNDDEIKENNKEVKEVNNEINKEETKEEPQLQSPLKKEEIEVDNDNDDDDDDDDDDDEQSDTSERFLHEIAKDTLAGTLEDSFVVKFVVLPHNGSVICSISFTAPYGYDMTPTKLSFTLYAKRDKLERIVSIYRLVEDKLMYLALVARALYARCPQYAVQRLHDEVCRTIWLLDSAAKLPGFTTMTAARFGAELSAAAAVFGEDFVARAVTSHLSTRGYTVVVAPDPTTLRVMTYVLATFLDARDLALSLPWVDRYCPGLVLQGVVGTLESAGVDEEQLMQAPLPTTIIDLSSPLISVRHPKGLKMYFDERKDYFQCIISILASKGVPGERPLFSNFHGSAAAPTSPANGPAAATIINSAGGGGGGDVYVVPGQKQLPYTIVSKRRSSMSSHAGKSVPSVSSLSAIPLANPSTSVSPSTSTSSSTSSVTSSATTSSTTAGESTSVAGVGKTDGKQDGKLGGSNGGGDKGDKNDKNDKSGGGGGGSDGKERRHHHHHHHQMQQQGESNVLQDGSIFLEVKESSKLVDGIISQALRLPLHLRQSFVKHSCTFLTYKAVSYLKLFASDM